MKPFDHQPELIGKSLWLRPLRPDEFESLYAVAGDPAIWALHPDPTRFQRQVFERFFIQAVLHGSLAVVDRATNSIVGSSRYYNVTSATSEVSIGFTFLARSHWGGRANGEMKALMIKHAFQTFERVWLHIGPENHRSRRAAEKIGAVFSHIGPVEIYGNTSEEAWYKIDSAHWESNRI